MIYGAASVPLMYLIGKRLQNAHVGILSAFLFAFSAYNIAQSQEIRYYSQFGFFALFSLYCLYRYLENRSKNWLMVWLGSSVLMIDATPNGLFPFIGGLALVGWSKLRTCERRRLCFALLLTLCVLLLGFVLQFRGTIFVTLQKLADRSPSQVLSDPTCMRGWNKATLMKFPFTVLNYVLGPNTNPVENWWLVAVTLLVVGGLFLWGVLKSENSLKYYLVLAYFVVPLILQIGIAEPLSPYQYATIEPKHVMYAFPIWLLFISSGYLCIISKKLKFLLGLAIILIQSITLYMYYFPSFSYYSGRFADIRLARPLFVYSFTQRDARDSTYIPVPAAYYGFQYKDLRLPFFFEDKPVLSGYGIGKDNSPWTADLSRPISAESISLLFNLENVHGIPDGAVVGRIKLIFESGRFVDHLLVYGENAADAFADYLGIKPTDPNVSIAKTWHKKPLITTSFNYPGVHASFNAYIYTLKVPIDGIEEKLEKIQIEYFANRGKIRIWGSFVRAAS